jgi:hypothetical protein
VYVQVGPAVAGAVTAVPGGWYDGHFCHQCIINTIASYTNNKTVPKKADQSVYAKLRTAVCEASQGSAVRFRW